LDAIRSFADQIIANVEKVIVGQREAIELLLTALLCEGHVLIEDVPGVGKTMLARSIAKSIGCAFRRIQFTPDMLPSDVTGVSIFNQQSREFEFREGPVFAQIVLADEINRATPKTQAALLEAMGERQVTVDGVTRTLSRPFLVLATQNPIEYEGTFPLPEAQLDRFIMKLSVGYPSPDEEQEILRRRRTRRTDEFDLKQITNADELLGLRDAVERVHVDPDIERYMVELVGATRKRRQVAVGASPRGSLALLKLSRAWAAMQSRDYVLPDDVKLFVRPALIHRLILEPDLWMTRQAADDVITDVTRSVAVPVVAGA
jgi:MoxR-like ATPase